MTSLKLPANHAPMARTRQAANYSLYERLIHQPAALNLDIARHFLRDQLKTAQALNADLPAEFSDLAGWVATNSRSVAKRYQTYLEGRRAGNGRCYFSNRAHALYFLQHVAPSKLVDGAWLYGTVKHGHDWRYRGLIRTYLEELGDGDPALNHVLLYRHLISEHDCAPTAPLEDVLYLQGTIQLALGLLSDEFLPEVLGYNLGYEQLPLHLLISAFELNELGIDPHYFTLHTTIDNASSGHALKAVEAVLNFLPHDDTRADFLARLHAGYRLNDLGKNTTAVIDSFDLEQEVIAMLEGKATFGQHMHSDYCKLEGRTINQWLATPGQSRQLLTALETKGWIKRRQAPQDSRFWQLIDGPAAVMFGVFNGYEKQLLKDWIAGDWQPTLEQNANPFRNRFRQGEAIDMAADSSTVASSQSVPALIELMAPGSHTTPAGLAATRVFSRRLSQGDSMQ
ncbi:iron-containing redox enzyme family protein [Pseudomonas vancouverensis]|uniref:iron-containing redox enzyme family protein n=1 Tax=Pseudomonas vancouverensis TaxID=95300 RepID=UPI003D09160F